ncbi:MerR family transcriptional regulator [Anaeromicropila herbilytica]|uniref:HTH merR-type domain-containing protein n=1 Tax=Anaeromicropila herbilytica TaxID=2785025 RepID=A0A7R7ICF2_9FIRM|nr:MerR family transcriptional regulator [Anaeromicropila herbilytica]BCN29854.1 hypothetical protein bsdtb5_11490 [Anaeromicropila herbilytica]
MEKLISISEISKELGISSRTLRYYEEEGLVNSIRVSEHSARLYTFQEIEKVKEMLKLRSFGFKIKEIKDLYRINKNNDNKNLSLVIKEQIEQRQIQLDNNKQKLHNIERAITLIQEDGEEALNLRENEGEVILEQEIQEKIAIECTEYMIAKQFHKFYDYLSSTGKNKFIPINNFVVIWKDLFERYGEFEKITAVETVEDEITILLRLSKLDMEFPLKYMFHGKYIIAIQIGELIFDIRI